MTRVRDPAQDGSKGTKRGQGDPPGVARPSRYVLVVPARPSTAAGPMGDFNAPPLSARLPPLDDLGRVFLRSSDGPAIS